MFNPAHKYIMHIIYDGLGNSVFQSLVLAPMLEMLAKQSNLEITLVSYESKSIPADKLMRLVPAHDSLHLVIFKRPPFHGRLGLWFGACQLHCLLCRVPCHHIVTRGPLAGWIEWHGAGSGFFLCPALCCRRRRGDLLPRHRTQLPQ